MSLCIYVPLFFLPGVVDFYLPKMVRLLSTTLVLSTAVSVARAYTVVAMQGFMFKNIDPIVHPGEYNSHMHTFFGSDAVNISTTASAELKTGCTTAENLNDHSVYCKCNAL